MNAFGYLSQYESVAQLLELQATRDPNKVAIVYRQRSYTYSEINNQANRVKLWLLQHKIRSGDRVLLFGANSIELVISLFGVLKAAAVFVIIHPKTSVEKLRYVYDDCSPVAIVTDNELLPSLWQSGIAVTVPILITSPLANGFPGIQGTLTAWDNLSDISAELYEKANSTTSLAAIIYTSGTTRQPRGVMLPHTQVLFATSAINAVIENESSDVILCGLPLSFDYGLYQIFLAFQVGARLILEGDFALPMAIPRIILEQGVTGFPIVPSLLAMLLRSRLLDRLTFPSLRYITSTGDTLPTAYIHRLNELYPRTTIYPMYGLTECKRVSIVPKGRLTGHEASVGIALPGTSVHIINAYGQEVPPGEVGELVVEGPHVMAGYWNNPIDTRQRFRMDERTGKILLYTGDFFWRDGDGFLYFVGRDETVIKSLGEKVSPAEIEAILYAQQGVVEAAAIGIRDEILGEAVYAFVSVRKSDDLDITDLTEKCRDALHPAARPRKIILLETPLPKTINGKIDRVKLRQMYENSS